MPSIEIVSPSSEKTPKYYRDRFMSSPGAVPWVNVGKLYLSLFETGNESWGPIFEQVQKQNPDQVVAVLTGRHGDVLQFVDKNGHFQGVNDANHLSEDTTTVQALRSRYPDAKVMPVDVTNNKIITQIDTVKGLRDQVKAQLQTGRVVILAWCFSIFCLKTIPQGTGQSDIANQYTQFQDTPIRNLVQQDWTFASAS